jgi:hypothetical protein
MFNIKRKDDTIVSKSVVPTSTARQLAKALTDNLKLKQELSKVAKDFNPEDGGISESQPVGPKGIVETIRDVENKKGSYSQQIVDKNKEIQRNRIEGHAAHLVKLDAKAIESQDGYRVEKNYTSRNGKVVLPTGCPTERIQAAIGKENTDRMNPGMAPFTTYQAWNDAPGAEDNRQNADSIARGFVHSSDGGIPLNTSKAVATYIVKQKYYMLRENGISYILNTENKIGLVRLVRDQWQFGFNNANSIKGDAKAHPFINLTNAEHADIIKAQPSYENVMSVYVQAINTDNLELNAMTAEKVW